MEFAKRNGGEICSLVRRLMGPASSFLGREREDIGYQILVAFDVLGYQAGVVTHENGGEVTGDL
jgi:hypothetical protein